MAAFSRPWETDWRQDKAPIDPVEFQGVPETPGNSPTRTKLQSFFGDGRGRARNPTPFLLTFNMNNIFCSYGVL